MLFPFLKYLKPIWYFNLVPKSSVFFIWVDYQKIDPAIWEALDFDNRYSNKDVVRLDCAYQLLMKGYMTNNENHRLNISNIETSIKDNYIFLRKYFAPIWSTYILLLRIIMLYNPVKELKYFFNCRKIFRSKGLYHKIGNKLEIETFTSPLILSNPKISIVIPTLNRYKYLKDGLKDLESQNYKNFDVIVVDQSEPFDKGFYDQFDLDIKLIYQEEKALWLARNKAIKASDAEWLLLYDDDSRVESDWITNHLKCADYFDTKISSGVSISVIGAKVPKQYAYLKWSDQLDTGNVLIHKSVFRDVGLFDRQFEKQRMGDGEFGLRCYLNNYKNISNSYAKRLHLKVGQGGLRQMGSWDAFRPKKILAPRPIPSVLYLARKYHGNLQAIFLVLINVPPSIIPYKFKSKRWLLFLGFLISILILPLILFQVFRSWHISSKMLNHGPEIEKL